MWAGFQIICVPFILRERTFSQMTVFYWGYVVALLLFAAGAAIRRRAVGARAFPSLREAGRKRPFSDILLWAVFWGLLLFQLIQAVRLAYADGDDAYYVAVSSITQESDTMYRRIPYTGTTTIVDGRHGLAPFPIWIAFLARTSGMQTVTVAQVILPLVLIAMTYSIFYLAGVNFFPEKVGKRPLFLVFTELSVIFGDYSIYTAENFMIARSRQGKAALGSIVIPFLILLLMVLLKKLQNNERIPFFLYLLLGAVMVTGCLCSTFGALLCSMMVGIVGLLACICYKKVRILLPTAVCCIPSICYVILYMILE